MNIKPLIPLCLAGFAGFLNLFGINPFIVDIADDLDMSVPLVGYTVTSALLMTAVAGIIVGPLSGRFGARRTLVVGLLIAGASAAITGISPDGAWLGGSRLIAGAGGAITGGVTIAAAAMIYSGRARQRAIAIVTASIAMAVVIGAFLMTSIAELYGWRGAYLVLGGFLAGIALLNLVMLQPDRAEYAPKERFGINTLINMYQPIFANRSTRRLLAASALHPAVINGTTAYVSALLVTQHNVSTQVVGIIFSLIGATYFIGNLIAGNLNSRVPQHVFVAGTMLMGTFWAAGYLIPLSPVFIAASFGIATFTGGIAWVLLLGMLSEHTPGHLGTTMVLSSALLSLGGAAGTAASATLLSIAGFPAIAIGMFCVALLAAAAGWIPADRQRDTATDRREVSRSGRGKHPAFVDHTSS